VLALVLCAGQFASSRVFASGNQFGAGWLESSGVEMGSRTVCNKPHGRSRKRWSGHGRKSSNRNAKEFQLHRFAIPERETKETRSLRDVLRQRATLKRRNKRKDRPHNERRSQKVKLMILELPFLNTAQIEKEKQKHQLRLLTPQQFREGYFEMVGGIAYQRKYEAIGRDSHGDIIVVDPGNNDHKGS